MRGQGSPGHGRILGAALAVALTLALIGAGKDTGPESALSSSGAAPFDPVAELALDRRITAEVRRAAIGFVDTADAQDLRLCSDLMMRRLRELKPECETDIAAHPPIEVLRIREIDLSGYRARVELTALIGGSAEIEIRLILVRYFDRWRIDGVIHRYA